MTPAELAARFKLFCRTIGLRLEPWQDLLVAEFFSPRRESVFLVPRGNGKSTLLAALGLFELVRDPKAAIVVAAASREQAGHLFNQARGFALASERLRQALTITRRELRSPTEGRLLVVSADAERQLGWDASHIFVDELGSHRDDSLYASLRTGLVKRPNSVMRVISTAGSDEESVLGQLHKRCLRLPSVVTEGPLTVARGDNLSLVEWRLPHDWPLERLHEVSPASWITADVIAEQLESSVPEGKLRRLLGNQWVAADDAFITAPEWDACAADAYIPPRARVVIAVDASVSHDCTSVVVVHRDGDDVFHARWRVWQPDKRHEVQLSDVEQYVRELAERYVVDAVIYDPRFFVQAAQNLADEGVPAAEWRHARMPNAVNTLRELIAHRRLRHGGDPVPRAHALAAETVEREYGLIITKRRTREPNDALVSLAMACEYAAGLKPARRSVYERRGLLAV
jgi:phage terminase large subunit-like protein